MTNFNGKSAQQHTHITYNSSECSSGSIQSPLANEREEIEAVMEEEEDKSNRNEEVADDDSGIVSFDTPC